VVDEVAVVDADVELVDGAAPPLAESLHPARSSVAAANAADAWCLFTMAPKVVSAPLTPGRVPQPCGRVAAWDGDDLCSMPDMGRPCSQLTAVPWPRWLPANGGHRGGRVVPETATRPAPDRTTRRDTCLAGTLTCDNSQPCVCPPSGLVCYAGRELASLDVVVTRV